MAHNITKTVHGKLYDVWSSMKSRCLNSEHRAWKNYGGRGITVCDEWQEFSVFKQWALENGYGKGLSLDRIDNERGYSPENCRFVTMRVQSNNTRANVVLTAFGERKTLAEWSKDPRCAANYSTVWMRIQNYGETAEDALSRCSQRQEVLAFGEYKSMAEWSRDPRCVVSFKTLRARIRRDGRDPEKAMTVENFKRYVETEDNAK